MLELCVCSYPLSQDQSLVVFCLESWCVGFRWRNGRKVLNLGIIFSFTKSVLTRPNTNDQARKTKPDLPAFEKNFSSTRGEESGKTRTLRHVSCCAVLGTLAAIRIRHGFKYSLLNVCDTKATRFSRIVINKIVTATELDMGLF